MTFNHYAEATEIIKKFSTHAIWYQHGTLEKLDSYADLEAQFHAAIKKMDDPQYTAFISTLNPIARIFLVLKPLNLSRIYIHLNDIYIIYHNTDPDYLERFCDHRIWINEGKIVLFHQGHHEYFATVPEVVKRVAHYQALGEKKHKQHFEDLHKLLESDLREGWKKATSK